MELTQEEREYIKKWIPLYLEKDMLVSMDQFVDFIMDDQPDLFCQYYEISVIYKDYINIYINILEKEIFSVNIAGEFLYTRLERWRILNLLALRALMEIPLLRRTPFAFEKCRDDIIDRNKTSGSLQFCVPDDSFFESFSYIIYEFPMRSRKWLPSTSLKPFQFSRGAIEFQSIDTGGKKTPLKSFDIEKIYEIPLLNSLLNPFRKCHQSD